MKMNWLEKLAVNNPIRIYMQQRVADGWLRTHRRMLAGKSVLEIGCGQGAGTELLLDRYGVNDVVAFDFDPAQLERAVRRLHTRPAVKLFVGDAESLPFDDARFGVVVDFAILHHVPNWQQAVGEIARVLKPDGWLFYEEFLQQFISNPVIEALFEHPLSARFTVEEFEKTLQGVGLKPAISYRHVRQWYMTGMAQLK
jgi:ubiquinone/menaquinone biosynthesis C-methylase UbiE